MKSRLVLNCKKQEFCGRWCLAHCHKTELNQKTQCKVYATNAKAYTGKEISMPCSLLVTGERQKHQPQSKTVHSDPTSPIHLCSFSLCHSFMNTAIAYRSDFSRVYTLSLPQFYERYPWDQIDLPKFNLTLLHS